MVPGIDRQPLKKLDPDPDELLRLLERWRAEAVKTGRTIERIVLAYEAGRDGFWLARALATGSLASKCTSSIRRAWRYGASTVGQKTDRLDTAMLKRVFLGWLRGERGHCGMVAIPTIEEEDAKRPSRERESLVGERTRIINRMKSTLARLGIRGFKPQLRKAPTAGLQRWRARRRSSAIPENTPRRDPPRHGPVRDGPGTDRGDRASAAGTSGKGAWQRGRMRWCACWRASSASASRQRTCWCERCCLGNCATDGPWRAMLA